jgi:hypothetical protein
VQLLRWFCCPLVTKPSQETKRPLRSNRCDGGASYLGLVKWQGFGQKRNHLSFNTCERFQSFGYTMLITNNFTNRGKRPRGQSDEEKDYDSSNQSLPRRISSEPAMIYGDADAVQLTPEIICYGAVRLFVLSRKSLDSQFRTDQQMYPPASRGYGVGVARGSSSLFDS